MRPLLFLALIARIALPQDTPKPAFFGTFTIERVASGFEFTEGPVWSKEGFLLFSDVPNNIIWKLDGAGKSPYREASNGANGNTFDAQGRLYSCESRTKRVVRTMKDGTLEVIADKFEGKRLNAPNDITVRKDGHVYFTDPAFGNQSEGRQLDYYGIYHLPPKGPLALIAKTTGRPNGVALSPNGRLLYVADSDDRLLRVFDVDRNGVASNMRTLITNIDGPPDGIRTDDKGNIWVTCNNIAVYSPEGKFLGKIDVPETPRNLTFGDPDFGTLYVTALKSVYRIRLQDVKGNIQY